MIFGRRKRSKALEILAGSDWRCATCKQLHKGMFDLAAATPDFWEGSEEYQPNGALRLGGDFLSEDFCVAGGEHFFVRCVFEIPVRGLRHRFGFGVWSTLSRKNFELYVDHFDDGAYSLKEAWSGWFGNHLKGVPADTLNQACWVTPRRDRQRPVVEFMDDTHPLARAQIEGVEPEFVLALYAANGHPVAEA